MWEVSPYYMLKCCVFTCVLATLTLAEPSRYDKQVRRSKRDIVIDAKFVGDALYSPDDKREEIPVPAALNAVPKDTVSDPSKDITNAASSAADNGDVKSTIPTNDKTKEGGSLLSKKLKGDASNTKRTTAKGEKSKESNDETKVVQSRGDVQKKDEDESLIKENFSAIGDEQNGSRKRRSTLHDAVTKHEKGHSNSRKRNHLAKKHRIVVSRPDIIYHQSPEIVHRPPIIVHRPDVVVHRPSIMVRRPAVVVHRPAIAYHQPPVIFSTPNPIIERPTAVSHDIFVQHSVPQPVGSQIEHVGAQVQHTHPVGHVVGVGHDIGAVETVNTHHAEIAEKEPIDEHGEFAHGEIQNVHGEDQAIRGEEQGPNDLVQGDEVQGQAEEDRGEVVQGPLTHAQHQEAEAAATEYAPAGNENVAHEAEPTGEATQEFEQGQEQEQVENVHQGNVIDGLHPGFETEHEAESLPQGTQLFRQGADPSHHGLRHHNTGHVHAPHVESLLSPEYDQPEAHHFPMMNYHPSQGGGTFDPAGGIMGMENPIHGDDQPWAKSHVPRHGHKHKRKHKKEKMKHIKGVKKSGGFGGELLPTQGFSTEKALGAPDCANGGCVGPQGIGGCGLLHGGPPCGDQFGASGGDLAGMNIGGAMAPPPGTVGGVMGGAPMAGAPMGGAPMGDHNAGCIEDCAGNDNHACCGTQSTVLYRPDVIFHPRPELYHRPDIIVHRPDVVIHRPSVVIHQPPVLVHRPSVVVHQPPIIFHQPAPEIRRPQLVSHDQYVTHPVPEKVGSEIHHTGNIIAHGGYYDGKDAGGLYGGSLSTGSIGAGAAGGMTTGVGGMVPGGGVDIGNVGGPCGGAVGGAVNCGLDQRTDVNEIPHGLDGAQEAVHFGNSLTSGACAEGSPCGVPSGAPGGCPGGGCGGAFGKSKVESPDKSDKATKTDGKEEKAEKKELKKEVVKGSKTDEKQAKKRKEIEKESKKGSKIVKRETDDSTAPSRSGLRIRKSVESTSETKKATNGDEDKVKRDCYEAHNTNCHTFPGHATVIHRPDVVFHQRPEIIHRPDIVVHRPDVVIHRPDVVIHRPALVVHKPPMVIKQSPIVFHQEHPVVQQPVQQANDMYVTHNVPLHVGSQVEEAGTQISNGCHYGDAGCVSRPYVDHTSGGFGGGLPGGVVAGGLLGGVSTDGIAAGGLSEGGYSTGSYCGHNPYSHDCGSMKKNKVARKKRKARKKHEISVTGSKRFFEDGGHGSHDEGYGEGSHGYGGHDGGGGGWHGGYDDGHAESHGGHHHFDFSDHSSHEGGHGHGHDGGDWGEHGDGGHGHGDHHGDHNVHHADEQNIIVQRPDIVFHPRPELYHRPDIVVHRPDIVIHRPSVVIHQPPVLVHRPAVIYHQPPVVFHQPGPVVHRPRVVSHDMYVQHAAKEQVGSQIEHAGGDFVGHGGYYEGHEHEGHGGHDGGYGGHGGYEDEHGEEDGDHGDHGDSGVDHEGGFHRDGGGDHEDGPNFHGFHFGDHGFGHHGFHGNGHGDDHVGDHDSGGPSFHGFHFGDHGFGHHGGPHSDGSGDHGAGPSFHGFHFGDHGFGHHGGPHGHGSGGFEKRSKIARHKHHKVLSGSKKHNVVVYRPPIIYHPPSEVYHRAPLIVHRPDVVIHRPAVVIHRPPVVVHRPDIIYHQSPVVFDTPPPKLHQEVVKQQDNFVMRPVLQHVSSQVHNTGVIHTSTGPKHETTTIINGASAPVHVLGHGHHGHHTALHQPVAHAENTLVGLTGGEVETGETVNGNVATAPVAEAGLTVGHVATAAHNDDSDAEPWPENGLIDHQPPDANNIDQGLHGSLVAGNSLGAQETLVDGDGVNPDNTQTEDVVRNDNAHGSVVVHAASTRPVHEVQNLQLTGGEQTLDHQEKPALNGQHVQVLVDGHNEEQPTEPTVALTGVDNSNELTHAAVGHAEGTVDNAEGTLPVSVEGKADEDVSQQAAEVNAPDGDEVTHESAPATVGQSVAEGHEEDEEGHTDTVPEHDDALAEDHHFAAEAKVDGGDDRINDVKTADDGQRLTEAKADDDDVHVDNEEISRGVTGNIHGTRHNGEVAPHHDDDEIITDNSLLEQHEQHEPEADGTAPAPEPAVHTVQDKLQHHYSNATPDDNTDADADTRDKTAVPASSKPENQPTSKVAEDESGSGKSTVTKKSDDTSKKEIKKSKKAKKRSKVDKKGKVTNKEIAKSRRRRESLLAKLSSSRIIQKRSTTPHKNAKVTKGRKNKKRSKMSKNVQGDDDDSNKKHRKSKKNDIVVKRPPVIYHPPPEIYHRPPIIVHRPPLVIRRPPIIYHQPPVIVHRPAVVYHQPPLVFHQPPPAVSQPILKSHDTFMMHPAAHLTHMGSMVTNAGTYVGVPEHRFMYQSGMGFLHAPGGGQENDHNAQNMQYGDEHHAEAEHSMPQEMEEGGGGGSSSEGGYESDHEHASINGSPQQMVDQAMNENDQSMNTPGGAESEMVDNNSGQQQGVENQNGGFQNEAAYGRNEVPGENQNMYSKNGDSNSVEQEYKSNTENKRKSIPKRENSTDTETKSERIRRQVDGMYSPYPLRQPYPYAQENNNNEEQSYFPNQNRHHRRTTVNVDVIGKRDAPNDEPTQNRKTHFLR